MSTNYLNITHKSKKTGNSTIIFDNTNSAGAVITTDGDLVTGMPITESMDDGMNTAVLHLKACNGANVIPELFEPYDIIEITEKTTITDETGNTQNKITDKQYLVGIDHRQIDNADKMTYEKTVSLVEPTKILDTIYIYNCNLTKKASTLAVQVYRLLVNAEPRLYNETQRLELSNTTYTLLNKFSSEDFFFDNITLREALYRIFEVAHIIPYVDAISFSGSDIFKIVIGHKSKNEFTPITDLSGYGEYMGDEGEVSIDNYFGTLKARGYNSVSKNIMKTGVRPFTTAEATLTEDNVVADLGLPIEDVTVFQIGGDLKLQITFDYLSVSSDTFVTINTGNLKRPDFFWNVGDKIIDNSVYELLTATEKESVMPYTKGDTVIGMSKTYKTVLLLKSTIKNLISSDTQLLKNSQIYQYCKRYSVKDDYNRTNYLTDEANITRIKLLTSITTLNFQAEFIPRIDTLIEVSKPGVYDNDRLKIGILDGQNANSIDIIRHGRTLGGLARRTGNEELMLDFHCDDFSQLMPVMGKFSGLTGRNSYLNGYVITKREHSVYDNQIKVRYYCTKDYQAINERIGVNREKRLYEIPLEATDCPIPLKYYITVSKNKPDIYSQPFDLLFRLQFVTGITGNTRVEATRISYMYFKCPEAGLSAAQYYALPCLAYGADKNVVFMAQPLDNYSAGYTRGGRKLDFIEGGGMQMLYNPYVDSNGEATDFTLYLASKQGVDNNISNGGGTYPKITKGNENVISDELHMNYFKDRTQRPVFFVSFEYLPKEDSYGDIVLGEAIATQNTLVISEDQPIRCVWIGDKVYETGDTKINGDLQTGVFDDYFEVGGGGDNDQFLYLQCNKTMTLKTGQKSIAIGDADKNLLIGFNMSITKGQRFYFEFKRKL